MKYHDNDYVSSCGTRDYAVVFKVTNHDQLTIGRDYLGGLPLINEFVLYLFVSKQRVFCSW